MLLFLSRLIEVLLLFGIETGVEQVVMGVGWRGWLVIFSRRFIGGDASSRWMDIYHYGNIVIWRERECIDCHFTRGWQSSILRVRVKDEVQ